jgi:hypothetical protein
MKKIGKVFLVVFCMQCILGTFLYAQENRFGNEWINYTAPYAKIGVYIRPTTDEADGIYRITYANLEAANFPVTSLNPKQLQLFREGEELAIRVVGEEDGKFDKTDYIEFYASGVYKSKLSRDLYHDQAESDANPYANMFGDYVYFFATVADNGVKTKRMAIDNERNAVLVPEVSHRQETFFMPRARYNYGNLHPVSFVTDDNIHGALFSHFTNGYCIVWNGVTQGASANPTFNFTDFVNKSKVNVEAMFVGRKNTTGEITLNYKTKTIGKITTNRYEGSKFLGEIDSVDIGGNSGVFSLNYTNTSAVTSNVVLSYIKVGYRQGFAMAQSNFRKFNLDAKTFGLAKMTLTGVLPATRFYDVTDRANPRLIMYDSTGNTRTMVIPNATIAKTIIAENRVNPITTIEKVQFKPINPDLYNYIIVAAPELFAPAGNTSNVIQAYADYRASQQGGGFLPLAIDIKELQNQFGHGFYTPLAIRRFADFMTNKSKNRMRGLFLIGRGTKFIDFTRDAENKLLTYGYPASDNEFVNGLFGLSRFTPAIPVGRIPAMTTTEVLNYLNKVKEHEALPTGLAWRKNILHLAGGTFNNENVVFKSYMDNYKYRAENGVWGMNVKTLQKQTTEYVERVNIREDINNGVALMTLFGHSSFEYTDIEISNPADVQAGYNNKGKYCMVFQNGCSGGDVFSAQRANCEKWLFEANKGAIAYLAHTHLGIDSYLNLYATTFYEVAFTEKSFINATLGEIIQETCRRITTFYDGDAVAITQTQQSLLQADPVLVMFGKRNAEPFPDFEVTEKDIAIETFKGEKLTANLDSFQLKIVVTNLGTTTPEKLAVSVTRRFSDFSTVAYPTVFYPPVRFRDTLIYTITTSKELKAKAAGINTFEVSVDFGNRIYEINEANNITSFTTNLKKASMLPIAPTEYSIVSKQPVYFVAQNTDAFTKERTYRFQLDTTATFTSPFRKDTVVFSYITPQWTTNLVADTKANDSIVYYWRVRYAELRADDDSSWVNSSFVYIKDSPSGWSQSRFPQFAKDIQKGISANVPTKKWVFPEITTKIDVNVIPYDNNRETGKWKDYYMNINDKLYAYEASCTEVNFDRGLGYRKLLCMAIDQQTGELYNPIIDLGDYNTGKQPCGTSLLVAALSGVTIISGYNYTPSISQYFSRVKDGDYVVLMPAGEINMQDFVNFPDVLAAFRTIGVEMANMQKLPYNTAFLWVGQKGAKTLLSEQIAPAGQALKTTFTIRRQSYQGTILSTLIGPAASWGNVFRTINGVDAGQNESYQLDVLGVDFTGKTTPLYNNVRIDALDIRNVNTTEYPYLQLKMQAKDSIKRTPYQLQRWQVVYKEVPEGILLYDTLSYRENTVLQVVEGDSIKVKFNFLNVSGNDFPEPLTVQYKIKNFATGRDTVFSEKLKTKLLRNQFQTLSVKLNSFNFKGDNLLTVYVNPKILAEQIYENNILEARFTVKPDDINPILEVAFDGKHLLNGDIVSPTPIIAINLKDENKFLLKKDTTGIDIFLKSCDNCTVKRINFNDINLTWTAASAGNGNKFAIEYRPNKLANGNYTMVIQGKDVTGNQSGKQAYQITFKVINENTVTNFYPYPNPFSTNTRFVFTLTGEIPEEIRVQILTITGKVVKTLFKEDLGTLRIGQNITEYAWDGTDEFGDKLANGVYLYKVDIKSAGKDYLHSSLSSDDLFKNGYGKMYLMR